MVKTAVYGKISRWRRLLFWACLQKKEHKRLWIISELVMFAVPILVAATICNVMLFWLCGITECLLYFPWLVAVDTMEFTIRLSGSEFEKA